MGSAQPVKRYTPQEYYRLEREATVKSEYFKGEIFAMSGGTAMHSRISSNLIRWAGNRLAAKPCQVFESNLRVKVKASSLRTYPDATVIRGPIEYDHEDPESETVVNPTVLFEVLSKTTEAYDRGVKADNYRMIESLQAYVLVAQDTPTVQIQERLPDGAWTLRNITGLENALAIPCLAIELPLSEIYERVEFPPPDSRPPPDER